MNGYNLIRLIDKSLKIAKRELYCKLTAETILAAAIEDKENAIFYILDSYNIDIEQLKTTLYNYLNSTLNKIKEQEKFDEQIQISLIELKYDIINEANKLGIETIDETTILLLILKDDNNNITKYLYNLGLTYNELFKTLQNKERSTPHSPIKQKPKDTKKAN